MGLIIAPATAPAATPEPSRLPALAPGPNRAFEHGHVLTSAATGSIDEPHWVCTLCAMTGRQVGARLLGTVFRRRCAVRHQDPDAWRRMTSLGPAPTPCWAITAAGWWCPTDAHPGHRFCGDHHGYDPACTGYSSVQSQGQNVTEAYSKKLTQAEPYPLADMNDSDERRNDRERLMRLNDPNKIGYLYLTSPSANGITVTAYFTIKGKVSSTMSQLTATQFAWGCHDSSSCVFDAPGDDGSYGPEEGGNRGIFFFTTDGVLVEVGPGWVYADAPLRINADNTLSYIRGSKPSNNAGQLR